jgi:hypothetical protein
MRAGPVRVPAALLAGGVAIAMTLVSAPAQAAPPFTTIATGLDNPRGLAFAPNGSLYVAEAGRGGPGPCIPAPEGGRLCFGATGAVTQIRHGTQTRVLTGLPSLVAEGSTEIVGPSDVDFRGTGGMYFTVGLGANPNERLDEFKDAAGWLLRGRIAQQDWRQVADIAGYEARKNPDGGELDSNPNSVAAVPGAQIVADAGGNSLLRVAADRKISTLAVFPDRLVPAPPELGLPPGTKIPMQAVPTSVVRGPDGAFYVGELTGFPFPPGAARVYRVVPGHAPQIFVAGFTNIIDIGFAPDGTLYVLEIFKNGLLSGDPTGALIRVDAGGSQHIVASGGLVTPAGLALRGHAAYVSNCGTCVGTGSVVRIPLR